MKEYKIEYLSKAHGFTRQTVYFHTFEQAMKWGNKNIDRFTDEMIQKINYVTI